MYQNIQKWQEGGMEALKWEHLRKLLVDRGNYSGALATYSLQKTFLPDFNTSEFWDKRFEESEISHPMENWRINLVLSKIKNEGNLLNLGVGKGKLEEKLLYVRKKITYTGTDITKRQLSELMKKFPQAKFLKENLTELSFSDNSFDQVLLLEVLEHIKPSETFRVLGEIYRVLKEKGIFVISVPVNEGLASMLPYNPNSHMRLYSEQLIRFELNQVGFNIIQVFQVSAFHKFFKIKNFINNIFSVRKPNNLVLICQK